MTFSHLNLHLVIVHACMIQIHAHTPNTHTKHTEHLIHGSEILTASPF